MILYLLYLPSIVQKALHKQKDAAALKPPHPFTMPESDYAF